ncbi:MAG: thioesterase family protein [Desulfobacterales bacterium]
MYEVDCIRDGKSFTTRRVVAIQKGRAILSMSASFQTEETGFEHQDPMPDGIPGPEKLMSEIDLARQIADKIPASIRNQILCVKPIEIRPVNPVNPFAPKKETPDRYACGLKPSIPCLTICRFKYMLAYASDFGLVSTSLRPTPEPFGT